MTSISLGSVESQLRNNFNELATSLHNLLNYELFVSEYKKTVNLLYSSIENNKTIWLYIHPSYAQLFSVKSGLNIQQVKVVRDGSVELITADFSEGDCLWLFSYNGSGDTLIDIANLAKGAGVHIVTFTSYPGSPLSSFGTHKIRTVVAGESFCDFKVQYVHTLLFENVCQSLLKEINKVNRGNK